MNNQQSQTEVRIVFGEDLVTITESFVNSLIRYIVEQLRERRHMRINFVTPIPVFSFDDEIVSDYIDGVWYDEAEDNLMAMHRDTYDGGINPEITPLEYFHVGVLLEVADKFKNNK